MNKFINVLHDSTWLTAKSFVWENVSDQFTWIKNKTLLDLPALNLERALSSVSAWHLSHRSTTNSPVIVGGIWFKIPILEFVLRWILVAKDHLNSSDAVLESEATEDDGEKYSRHDFLNWSLILFNLMIILFMHYYFINHLF